ncbi:MAG: menaquinone biosynthesis decarboxylase [Bacteroidales bacterium]|nr:menaquinone biosynthesis decarboxylase [Bacteroidales bacterium]
MKEFIEVLEKNGELLRINKFVDPVLEIAEITDRISKTPKGGKALLFENNGTNFPVLTNAFGSDYRMSLSLGVQDISDIADKINQFIVEFTSPKITFGQKISALGSIKQLASILPQTVKSGKCQEVIIKNADLNILPVLKTWPDDGGRFITLPLVNTIDPITNIRNLGMYRLQVFDKNLTGMHWHKHKVGARHYNEYKKLNKKIPVAVALGGDPVYTYAATAPLPDNTDEYILAGFLRNKGVKLVKCITQNIEVPADSDIVIEGYIDPNEELIWEGPFGDHTGFYSLPDYYPKFHVTCITHRKDAVYPATLVGVPPQEDAYFAKATEKLFLPLMQKSIAPEVIDMHLPQAGVAHNFTSVKIKSDYEGQALKVMNSLWGNGQMALNKCLFITDLDVELSDFKKFAAKSLKNFNPKTDVYYSQGPMDVLDHASEKFTLGSKIGFDFTNKIKNENYVENQFFDEVKFLNYDKKIKKTNNLTNIKIPILLVAISKKMNVLNFATEILQKQDLSLFKIIVFIDDKFDVSDLYSVAWLVGNNIAPLRDTKIVTSSIYKNTVLLVDATTKMPEFDDFDRQWPNIVVMNSKTIDAIDKKWNNLEIGDFIPSPSHKYKH